MITSSIPAEGKTTVAYSLGKCSRLAAKVLVVDGDLRNRACTGW
jgi:Mrp family chromosome partitioning ATPase